VSVIDLASGTLLAAGGLFCVVGAVGMLRMPDFFTRAHASSVIETLGAGLILAGLALQSGLTLASAKLLVLAMLILFASPTATHALCKAARERGVEAIVEEEGK